MERMLKVLKGCIPHIDFEQQTELVTNGVLDSLDIVTIVTEITDAFAIDIPPEEIVAENFNSVQAMLDLVDKLQQVD